jgi:hypothetical protein
LHFALPIGKLVGMVAEIEAVARTMLAGLPRSVLGCAIFVAGVATGAAPGAFGLNLLFISAGLIIGAGCGVMAGVLVYQAGDSIPTA